MSIEQLRPLIGDWTAEVDIAEGKGTVSFEYALDGAFVLQRSGVDHPDVPDTLAVIAPDGDAFLQHYFDSRGVVRLYAMTFDGRTLTFLREKADFSELGFRQRYVGELSEDGRTITGEWQTGDLDGGEWKKDFGLTYRRVS
jgi:hypothetical protein